MDSARALCVFNGVDGVTGEYRFPPQPLQHVAEMARREPRYQLPDVRRRRRASPVHNKGPGEEIDARDLAQAGWGVIFGRSIQPAVREALEPLLGLRRQQSQERFYDLSYVPGENKSAFLARHEALPGAVDPTRLPYYLLLVGGPEEISFEFQYQLDVQYAVGRIHFRTARDYARYAHSVVAAETGAVRRARIAAFFGPRNPDDPATQASTDNLLSPLAQLAAQRDHWRVSRVIGEQATKACLGSLLEGESLPAFLFTASHGLCFPEGTPHQSRLQGALVCQDWPGPLLRQPIGEDSYYGADDLSASARVAGLIAFHFSCFGAGTPLQDEFPQTVFGRRRLSRRPFLARLAQRLLAHPSGGALAVVGHIDRAMGWSFQDKADLERPGVFENCLKRLLGGAPLGYAMEYLSSCYTELASDLDDEIRRPRGSDDRRIANLWTNRNDARNYAVLGDPAVRLAVGPPEEHV